MLIPNLGIKEYLVSNVLKTILTHNEFRLKLQQPYVQLGLCSIFPL